MRTFESCGSVSAGTKRASERAIDVARGQNSRTLELGSTVSRARLWHQHGKRNEAKKMLGETYGWFTEGFDTPDLEEAKVLLDEL